MSPELSIQPLHRPIGWRANVLTQALALTLSSQMCAAYAADRQRTTESGKRQGHSVRPIANRRANPGNPASAHLGRRVADHAGVDVNSWGGANDANVRIRGVGSLNQISVDDGSVVLSVDGVPMSVRNAALATLDVQQVEVLKGPQGTLLGRNSEAGAIIVTTRKPIRELEGYVRGEAGQQGRFMTEGAVGGTLTESLSGRLAVRSSGFDNWVTTSKTTTR